MTALLNIVSFSTIKSIQCRLNLYRKHWSPHDVITVTRFVYYNTHDLIKLLNS